MAALECEFEEVRAFIIFQLTGGLTIKLCLAAILSDVVASLDLET